MFRHKGKSRKFKQNLGIASLLSFVAGVVNVVGFLAVQQLTTNVTGHFALMVEEASKTHTWQAVYYFAYVFFFFLGAFSSRFMIEITGKLNEKYVFVIPVLVEFCIITSVALLGYNIVMIYPHLIACALLFAMGLQNSLVTTISDSVVRTTHLTGLFTDLGIEMSQLFFRNTAKQRKKLISSIELRLTIIFTFFAGGVMAGFLFSFYQIRTLLLASLCLLAGLLTDYLIGEMRKNRITVTKTRLHEQLKKYNESSI